MVSRRTEKERGRTAAAWGLRTAAGPPRAAHSRPAPATLSPASNSAVQKAPSAPTVAAGIGPSGRKAEPSGVATKPAFLWMS